MTTAVVSPVALAVLAAVPPVALAVLTQMMQMEELVGKAVETLLGLAPSPMEMTEMMSAATQLVVMAGRQVFGAHHTVVRQVIR